MDTTKTQNDKKTEIINYQPTQMEMKDILISKIKHYKNVDIKLKEVTNAVGVFYAITTYIKLDEISNGIFHSATLKTVSYNKRTVNIKCVFSDNENLIHDMEINRDSVFQCFRDIAPDTITDISLEKFNDQSDKPHVRIIASTIKGSSLIYVYKRLMDFVNIINEKYGNLVTTPNKYEIQPAVQPAVQPVIQPAVQPVVQPAVQPVIQPAEIKKDIEVKKNEIKNINSNFTLSDQIIKDLEFEEIRLQAILDNIKLLKQTQIKFSEQNSNTNNNTIKPQSDISIHSGIATSAATATATDTNTSNISPPTFASKVKNSLKN
jgi:hypothetical protein